jgi:hypothetical protein
MDICGGFALGLSWTTQSTFILTRFATTGADIGESDSADPYELSGSTISSVSAGSNNRYSFALDLGEEERFPVARKPG